MPRVIHKKDNRSDTYCQPYKSNLTKYIIKKNTSEIPSTHTCQKTMITYKLPQKGLSSCLALHALTKSTVEWEVTIPETTGSVIATSSSSSMPMATGHGAGTNEPTTTNRGWCVMRSCRRRRWVRSQANH